MPSYGPALQLNDIVQVRSVSRMNDQLGLNIFHFLVYQVPEAPNAVILSNVIDAFEGMGFGEQMKSLMVTQAQYKGLYSRVIWPGANLSVEFFSGVAQGAGAVAGDALPRQVSGLLSKRANVPGRRKGGRFYVPFPGEVDNDASGIPSEDYVNRLGALAATLTSQLTGGAGPTTWRARPIILKRALPTSSNSVGSVVTNRRWATQRRRGSFGRPNPEFM